MSTKDKGQTPQNQLRELRRYCDEMSYMIAGEYIDRESGRLGTHRRKQFAKLFEDAAKRKFDLVLLWSLDRFSPEGMMNAVNGSTPTALIFARTPSRTLRPRTRRPATS